MCADVITACLSIFFFRCFCCHQNVLLYLFGGRDWWERQMKESSLDMALQAGAPADRRAAVISSTGRGRDARSSCDNFERLGGCWLFPRPFSGAVSEWMYKPAQGSHGCLHWGVVTDNAQSQSRAACCSKLARNAVGISSRSGIKGRQIEWEGRKCWNLLQKKTKNRLNYVSRLS